MSDKRLPDAVGDYRCTNCGLWKPPSEFYKSGTSSAGIMSWCKVCVGSKRLQRTPEERERAKAAKVRAAEDHERLLLEQRDRKIYDAYNEMMARRTVGPWEPQPLPPSIMNDADLEVVFHKTPRPVVGEPGDPA